MNISSRQSPICNSFGLEQGSADEWTDLLTWSQAQLRASNLRGGLGVIQVSWDSSPASAHMTGEWARPQGGLNVIALAKSLQSSDSETRHGEAQQPRKAKIKTKPTNTHTGKIPSYLWAHKPNSCYLPGWTTDKNAQFLRGKNTNKPIKKTPWLESHG